MTCFVKEMYKFAATVASTSASTEIVGVAMVRLRMLSRSRAVIGMLCL